MCCIQIIFRCEDGFRFECEMQSLVMKKVIRGQKETRHGRVEGLQH